MQWGPSNSSYSGFFPILIQLYYIFLWNLGFWGSVKKVNANLHNVKTLKVHLEKCIEWTTKCHSWVLLSIFYILFKSLGILRVFYHHKTSQKYHSYNWFVYVLHALRSQIFIVQICRPTCTCTCVSQYLLI